MFYGSTYEAILFTLKELKLCSIELTIRFSNNLEIQSFNNLWRNKNEPTNVLAFPNKSKITRLGSLNYLGDIIISYDKIKEESVFYNVSFKDHLMHLIIHGVLHLMGYDHDNTNNENKMIKLEEKILKKIGANSFLLNKKYNERN